MKKNITASLVAAVLSMHLGTAVNAACPEDGGTPFTAGPVNPNNGFAEFVQDSNGLALELCLDSTPPGSGLPPNCTFDPVDPANPFSVQIGFGAEGFWWLAQPDTGAFPAGVAAVLVMGAEAAFGAEVPIDGDQFPFTRLRIRLDVPAPGFYRVTHPYGQQVFDIPVVGAGQEVRESFDIPFVPGVAGNQGRVGPWLSWDGTPPAPPAGFIGDGTTPHPVTGSPCGTNFLRIEAFSDAGLTVPTDINGPGGICDGDGVTGLGPDTACTVNADCDTGLGSGDGICDLNNVRTNDFTVTGKIWDGVLATSITAQRTSYARDADPPGSSAQVDVFASGTATANVNFTGGPNLPVGVLPLLGDGTGSFFASELLTPDASVLPPTVTVNATDSVAGTDPTTLIRPLTDVVNITRAEYDVVTQTLSVEARSSDTLIPPTLTVAELGLTLPVSEITTVPPGTVTVLSAAGGTETALVSVVDSTDSDGDGVPDTLDNCTAVSNGPATPSILAANIQRDTDGDGYGNICDPDLTGEGNVNVGDLTQFAGVFPSAAPGVEPFTLSDHADFNGDGGVNVGDLTIFSNFFPGVPGPSCCGIALP